MKEILDFHCPRYSELPKVFLYKDQVIIYIEQILKTLNIIWNLNIYATPKSRVWGIEIPINYA